MLIKNLLQSWLLSNHSWVAKQGLPETTGEDDITWYGFSGSSKDVTVVSPVDGYAVIHPKNSISKDIKLRNLTNQIRFETTGLYENKNHAGFVPVRKGDSVFFGADRTIGQYCYFVKSIGA